MMRRGGWRWAPDILLRLGVCQQRMAPPDGRAAAIWSGLRNSGKRMPPRGTPGIKPVMPDAARERLAEMLGSTAETRASQSDYAAATAAVFASPDSGTTIPPYFWQKQGLGQVKRLAILPRPACGQSAMTARYGYQPIPVPCNIKSLRS